MSSSSLEAAFRGLDGEALARGAGGGCTAGALKRPRPKRSGGRRRAVILLAMQRAPIGGRRKITAVSPLPAVGASGLLATLKAQSGAPRRRTQRCLTAGRTRRRSRQLGCEPDAIFRRHLRDDPRLDDVSRRFAKVDVEVLGDRSQDHQLDAGVVASLSEPLFRKRA